MGGIHIVKPRECQVQEEKESLEKCLNIDVKTITTLTLT